MENSKKNIDKHPEIKIDEQLNLGLDADQSSDGPETSYNTDNDQASGNQDHKVYSPLDDK